MKRKSSEDRLKTYMNRKYEQNNITTLLNMVQNVIKENEELKAERAREKEDRQYDDLGHKRELADLFKGKYEKK